MAHKYSHSKQSKLQIIHDLRQFILEAIDPIHYDYKIGDKTWHKVLVLYTLKGYTVKLFHRSKITCVRAYYFDKNLKYLDQLTK